MVRQGPSPLGRSGQPGASAAHSRVLTCGDRAHRWVAPSCLDGLVARRSANGESQCWPAYECDGWCPGGRTRKGRALLPRGRAGPPSSAGYLWSRAPAVLGRSCGSWLAGHRAAAAFASLGGVMRLEPRPELLHMPAAIHGALDFAELDHLGLAPEAVLDFSVNGNPYGPSPLVREAMAQVPYDRYPDREVLALRRVLSTHLDVTSDQVLVGNGSTELVWLVALAFVRAGDTVLLVGPTFGEYTRAAVLMGARLHQYTARRAEVFCVVPEAITQLLQQRQPRLVFLCNPNNPTGTFVAPDSIAHWAATFPRTLFIVDEAYLTFTASAPSVLPVRRPNMLVLRSMTKAYALAGLRLGYAVGSPDILEALRRARPP